MTRKQASKEEIRGKEATVENLKRERERERRGGWDQKRAAHLPSFSIITGHTHTPHVIVVFSADQKLPRV